MRSLSRTTYFGDCRECGNAVTERATEHLRVYDDGREELVAVSHPACCPADNEGANA